MTAGTARSHGVRTRAHRLAITLLTVLAALATLATLLLWPGASAWAARPFTPELDMSASTYAAGQHPQLTLTIAKTPDGFHDDGSFYDEQDFQEIDVALPSGLTINPRGVPYCGLQTDPAGDWCANPDAEIGTGSVDVEVWIPLTEIWNPPQWFCDLFPELCSPAVLVPICPPTFPATVYNEQPATGEQARTVTIVPSTIVSTVTVCGLDDYPIQIPEVTVPGFSLANGGTFDGETLAPVLEAKDMPNTIAWPGIADPLPLNISRVSFTLDGTRGQDKGLPLVSNPTSCDAHTATGTFTSYGDDDVASGDDRTATDSANYPVEGCDALAYNPALALTLTPTTALAQPAMSQVVTQAPGEAATGSVTFSMPAAFKTNPSRVLTICTDEQIAARSCPDAARLASVSLTTPLLSEPLTGSSYMGPAVGDKVRVVTLLGGPVSTTMEGTLWQRPDGGMDTVTQNMPDIPVERIEYTSVGGDQATFMNPTTCGTQTVSSTFTSLSGKTSVVSSPITIDGCLSAQTNYVRRLRASIAPRKPRRPARLHLFLSQDPAAELAAITYRIGGGLRWRLAGQRRGRALATVEMKPEDGATKIVDLYPTSSGKRRLRLKSRSRKYPVAATISSARRGGDVTLKLRGLPDKPVYDVYLSVFGKRNNLLRTPARCKRSAAVEATVTGADGTRAEVTTPWSPGCVSSASSRPADTP